jgi:serine/threonine-protein kinase RsbW
MRGEPARASRPPAAAFTGLLGEVHLCRAEELAPLLEAVAGALAALDYPPRDRLGVRLALEEAVVNGLRHGNHGDPEKLVRVRYLLGADDVLAEVEDEGAGFDPGGVADPTAAENWERTGGRGLVLMRHYMTWVRFSARGNRVTLYKRRPA